MGTYNRAHLLARSLECYARQSYRNFTLIIYDDGSTDNTREVCANAQMNGLNIDYIRLEKEPGTWRDSAAFLNAGIAKALHDYFCQYVFITHPEIMPGRDVLRLGVEHLYGADVIGQPVRYNCKGYYLSQSDQEHLDTVNWKDDIMSVRKLPGFYDTVAPHPDYSPSSVEKIDVWGSWIFGGFSRKGWQRFGGVYESPTWGAVDVEMFNRTRVMGINTITPAQESAWVLHQNHDRPSDTPTPRIEDDWKRELNGVEIKARPELIAPLRFVHCNYIPV